MIVNVVISRETRTPAFSCQHISLYACIPSREQLALETGRVGRYETTYRGPEDALTMTKPPLSAVRSHRECKREPTSLVIQLLQNLPDDLSHGL